MAPAAESSAGPGPAPKKVVVIIRGSPLNSTRPAEALRASVGLTLAKNKLRVIFIEDGIWMAAPLHPEAVEGPEVGKHLEALLALGVPLVGDQTSRQARRVKKLRDGVELLSRGAILDLITSADVVIPFA